MEGLERRERKEKALSRIRLSWTGAHPASLSLESLQASMLERNLPHPGLKLRSPTLQAGALPFEPSLRPRAGWVLDKEQVWLDLNLPKREKYVFTGLRTGGSGPGRQVEPRALRSRVEPGLPGEIGVGSHGELLICPESGIKREKQGQNLKGQRVHFTVQKGDGLKQAGTVVQMVKNPLAMQETRVPSPSGEDPLEEGTAAHSGILAWRIPRREELGGLRSMESQRGGHD